MCPACFANLVLVVIGATSGGTETLIPTRRPRPSSPSGEGTPGNTFLQVLVAGPNSSGHQAPPSQITVAANVQATNEAHDLISTRILTRRRLGSAGVQHAPARRRRRTRGFVQVASSAAVDRLHLNAFGHAYLGLGAVLICILFYLALAAQITQSSYDIAKLQDQQRQLLAEQDQLRYQEVTQHAPA